MIFAAKVWGFDEVTMVQVWKSEKALFRNANK